LLPLFNPNRIVFIILIPSWERINKREKSPRKRL